MKVLGITSEISKQIFPFTLNLDDQRFRDGLDRLVRINERTLAAKAQGGLIGLVKRAGLGIAGAAVFARLYTLPVVSHELPKDVRLAPTW